VHVKKTQMKKLYFIILSVLIMGVANGGHAQITTGIISGKVTDQKGITLPGVTISVVNTSTGTRYGNQTNNDGRFTALPTLTRAALILLPPVLLVTKNRN
jgi:type IV secretory pathway VirB6-like protein